MNRNEPLRAAAPTLLLHARSHPARDGDAHRVHGARLLRQLWPGIAASLIGVLLVVGAKQPGREITLPLDDAYIHLQYGWQAAKGHLLQYNAGDTPTSGATSLLYMALIALHFAVGVTREAIPIAIVVEGIACYALASIALAQTAHRLAALMGLRWQGASTLVAIWFAGSGWMAWSFLSGMETGWLTLFVAATLWAVSYRRAALAAIFAALAALTRPEAVLLGPFLLFAEIVAPLPSTQKPSARVALGLAPVLAAFVSPLLNWTLTGSLSPTGLLAKSWFTNEPFDSGVITASSARTFLELSCGLMGGRARDGAWHTLPLLQCLAAVGAFSAWRRPAARAAAIGAGLWSVGLMAVTSTLQTATWHHYRYQMPAYPALVVVGGIGAATLVSRVRGTASRWVGGAVIALGVAWSCYSLVGFARAYRADTHTMAQMQVALSRWVRDNTPPDARIVVHDVGAVRYLGDRYTIDAVGLTTTGMVRASRGGPGTAYEALRRLEPEYYAIYPDHAPPYFGVSAARDLLGEELYRVTLPSYSPYTSAADTQVVARPDWRDARLAVEPQQPNVATAVASLTLVDALNVADIADEDAHGYRWWSERGFVGFVSDVRHMPYRLDGDLMLTDGGRVLTGGQSFMLQTPKDASLWLVGRFHQTTDAVMTVEVNGAPAGEWRLPTMRGEWQESLYEVPAALIAPGSTRITITLTQDVPDAHLGVFYLWAYQGNLNTDAATADATIRVAFDEVAQLIGHNLGSTSVAAGDVLPVELHWTALRPPRAPWRVFVHLIDPQNDTAEGIVAQWDAEPFSGTYPFWVWKPGEQVSTPLTLTVPENTRPSEYHLLVGLYDAATGERAALDSRWDYAARRYLLTPIQVIAP